MRADRVQLCGEGKRVLPDHKHTNETSAVPLHVQLTRHSIWMTELTLMAYQDQFMRFRRLAKSGRQARRRQVPEVARRVGLQIARFIRSFSDQLSRISSARASISAGLGSMTLRFIGLTFFTIDLTPSHSGRRHCRTRRVLDNSPRSVRLYYDAMQALDR